MVSMFTKVGCERHILRLRNNARAMFDMTPMTVPDDTGDIGDTIEFTGEEVEEITSTTEQSVLVELPSPRVAASPRNRSLVFDDDCRGPVVFFCKAIKSSFAAVIMDAHKFNSFLENVATV